MVNTVKLFDEAETRIKRKNTYTVLDANGNIVEDVRVITPLQQEQASKKKELQTYLNNKTEKHFTFVDMRRKNILEQISLKHLGYFLVLQTYQDYKGLIMKPDGKKKPMKKADIGRATLIQDRRALNSFLDIMLDYGLLYMDEVECYGKTYEGYFVNPAYSFRKGVGYKSPNKNRSVKCTVKVFINELQKLYNQESIKPSDIGFLYRTLEYVQLDNNMLTLHPEEEELFPHYLGSAELAELLGVTQRLVDRKMCTLELPVEYNGRMLPMKVYARIRIGGEVYYKVNPLIMTRTVKDVPHEEYALFLDEALKTEKRRAKRASK